MTTRRPRDNHSYKSDGLGIFSDGSEDHYKVVAALLARGYSTDRIAKTCGLTESKVREYAERWKRTQPR